MTHTGSLNSRLKVLQVGDRIFIESTLKGMPNIQRQVASKTRWPKSMEGFELRTTAVTGVTSKLGEIIYLVCVERTR